MSIKSNPEKAISERSESGILSLEAAICMPFFILVLIILLYILQAAGAYTRANRALCKTSEYLAAYANLYHTHAVEGLENKLLTSISKKTDGIGKSESVLKEFINAKTMTDKADDLLYSETSLKLYEKFYKEDDCFLGAFTETFDENLIGSTFFENENIIKLKLTCKIKPLISFPEKFFPYIRLKCTKSFRCWLYGKQNSVAVLSVNVWEMDNLSRGKYLRSEYGANLPEYYPVISIFSSGEAVMIKSIDHTAPTYESGSEIKSSVKKMIKNLAEFDGTDNKKYEDYTPVIKSDEIKSKKLILVFPINEMNEKQRKAVIDMSVYAGSIGITLETELYGESSKYMVK